MSLSPLSLFLTLSLPICSLCFSLFSPSPLIGDIWSCNSRGAGYLPLGDALAGLTAVRGQCFPRDWQVLETEEGGFDRSVGCVDIMFLPALFYSLFCSHHIATLSFLHLHLKWFLTHSSVRIHTRTLTHRHAGSSGFGQHRRQQPGLRPKALKNAR